PVHAPRPCRGDRGTSETSTPSRPASNTKFACPKLAVSINVYLMSKRIEICTVLSLVLATGTMPHAAIEQQSVAFQTSPIGKGIEIRGNRRVPTDRIRSELQTKSGNSIDLSTVSRDIRALYSLGYFDDVQFETENASGGPIIIFSVKEKPLVRAIE